MKTTPKQRRQWREIADAATPGPWCTDPAPRFAGAVSVVVDGVSRQVALADGQAAMFDCERGLETHEVMSANARFVAAARTAIPALLDDVTELEAEVDRLREKVSDMRSERVRADEKHKTEVEQLKAALGRAHRKLDRITLTAANGRRAGLGPHRCKCIVDEAFVEQADADLVGMVAK